MGIYGLARGEFMTSLNANDLDKLVVKLEVEQDKLELYQREQIIQRKKETQVSTDINA